MKRDMILKFDNSDVIISDIKYLNDSFDIAKLRIAYTGLNRNNCFISKEVFEKAIPTMFNCPIVANYIRETNDFGSHDVEFLKNNKNQQMEMINITQPVGVIPESSNWGWEIVESTDGVIHEYLYAEALLWKRQEAYTKIKDNKITKQSMEISIDNGRMKKGCYHINNFSFTAFCLLGDNIEPCFEEAALLTFSKEQREDFKNEFSLMLNECKEILQTFNNNNFSKKGEDILEKKRFIELCTQYSIDESLVDYHEDLTEEELVQILEEIKSTQVNEIEVSADKDAEIVIEDNIDEVVNNIDIESDIANNNISTDSNVENNDIVESDIQNTQDSQSFVLVQDLVYQLSQLVDEREIISVTDMYDGEERVVYTYCRYAMQDIDIDSQEIYYFDTENGILLGAIYKIDGDVISIDFDNEKRKKIVYVDFINPTEEDGMISDIEGFKDFNKNKAHLEYYKKLHRQADEQELFSQFEDKLSDSKEYQALKEKSNEYSLNELSKELFALVGKMEFALNRNKITKVTLSGLSDFLHEAQTTESRYGEYLIKK